MLPQDNATPRTRQQQLQPPVQQPAASGLIDTIHMLLASREDAEDILDAVAERLWFRSDSNADERIRAPLAVEFMRGEHADASAPASSAVGGLPDALLSMLCLSSSRSRADRRPAPASARPAAPAALASALLSISS